MSVTTTKRIGRNGTSLALNITKEARMLGLKAGDDVEIVLRRIPKDGEQEAVQSPDIKTDAEQD